MVFLWPLSQYEVWDHKIWGERTSDRSFHGPNVKYTVGSTCSQQALPKIANFWKNDLFNNFEVHVVKLKTRKWALTSGADIFTSFEYFHMKKGTQKVEISDFRFMYYIKWSLKYIKWICAKCDLQVKMLIPRSVLKDKKLAFSLFLMSFRFYDVIFGVKGLEMNTYKLLKLIWVQRHHEVNTCSSKYSTMPKMSLLRTFLQQKLHKNKPEWVKNWKNNVLKPKSTESCVYIMRFNSFWLLNWLET